MLPTTTPPMRTSMPGITNAALLKIARTWYPPLSLLDPVAKTISAMAATHDGGDGDQALH